MDDSISVIGFTSVRGSILVPGEVVSIGKCVVIGDFDSVRFVVSTDTAVVDIIATAGEYVAADVEGETDVVVVVVDDSNFAEFGVSFDVIIVDFSVVDCVVVDTPNGGFLVDTIVLGEEVVVIVVAFEVFVVFEVVVVFKAVVAGSVVVWIIVGVIIIGVVEGDGNLVVVDVVVGLAEVEVVIVLEVVVFVVIGELVVDFIRVWNGFGVVVFFFFFFFLFFLLLFLRFLFFLFPLFFRFFLRSFFFFLRSLEPESKKKALKEIILDHVHTIPDRFL